MHWPYLWLLPAAARAASEQDSKARSEVVRPAIAPQSLRGTMEGNNAADVFEARMMDSFAGNNGHPLAGRDRPAPQGEQSPLVGPMQPGDRAAIADVANRTSVGTISAAGNAAGELRALATAGRAGDQASSTATLAVPAPEAREAPPTPQQREAALAGAAQQLQLMSKAIGERIEELEAAGSTPQKSVVEALKKQRREIDQAAKGFAQRHLSSLVSAAGHPQAQMAHARAGLEEVKLFAGHLAMAIDRASEGSEDPHAKLRQAVKAASEAAQQYLRPIYEGYAAAS